MHALYVLLPALGILAIAYRYYSAFIATKVWMLDDARKTPAHTKYDGANFYPTSRWVMFGHHFAAITGAGPLLGPMLAAQFGYAPGFIWLVAGCCLAGAVHDSMILWASTRRGGKSLPDIVKAEISPIDRLRRGHHDPLHPGRRAGRARRGVRERAGRQRLGHVHGGHDHPARHVHGLLDVRVAQGQDHRSHRHRRRRACSSRCGPANRSAVRIRGSRACSTCRARRS